MPARRSLLGLEKAIVLVLLVSFVLLAQPVQFFLYEAGLLLLIAATVVQIAVSNVPENSGVRGVIRGLLLTVAIFGGLIVVGILLVPSLMRLGR